MSEELEFYEDDGSTVHVAVSEDGEILDDNLPLWLVRVARNHVDANRQVKRWEDRERALEKTLSRYHPSGEKSVQYGGVRATLVQPEASSHSPSDFAQLVLDGDCSAEEMRAILCACTKLARGMLPPRAQAWLDQCTYKVPRESYLLTTETTRRLK